MACHLEPRPAWWPGIALERCWHTSHVGRLSQKCPRKQIHLCWFPRQLMLPVFRYVDDFFAPERPAQCPGLERSHPVCFDACRLRLMEHAMRCFARLIRAVLGQSSIADRKVECGKKLVILGVEVPTLLATPVPPAAFRCRWRPARGQWNSRLIQRRQPIGPNV